MKIGRISIVVEIDGSPCAVVLPYERLEILVSMAASLSDSGKLPVKKLGDDYKFHEIKDL